MAARWFTRLVAPTLALGLISVAVGAQSVHVNYDRTADFKALKTYAFGTVTTSGDAEPVLVQRVLAAVDSQMSAIGFQKVETNPDVLVATEVWRGVSYPSWWSKEYTEIDLQRPFAARVVLEMTDARTGRILFRGTAKDRVSLKPSRNERKADEAVAEIFEKSPWGADFDDD